MVSKTFVTLFILGTAAAFPARAEDGTMLKGVVELFTSQGCSSCPPADKAFETLARQGDVLALAYHVDYWNYLGWNDTLATPENTARQYGYAKTLGRSGVYTPQAVINGRDHMKGTDVAVINHQLEDFRAEGRGLSVPVHARIRGDEIEISIGAGQGKADVVAVYYRNREDVAVAKGENKGKTITYRNSVTDVQTVGMWDGKDLHLTLPANVVSSGKNDGCAILLQASGKKGEPGAILGAAILSGGKG
ncbi:MAG: DUF1223 domain-containing protein [Allorhizobium sp.]